MTPAGGCSTSGVEALAAVIPYAVMGLVALVASAVASRRARLARLASVAAELAEQDRVSWKAVDSGVHRGRVVGRHGVATLTLSPREVAVRAEGLPRELGFTRRDAPGGHTGNPLIDEHLELDGDRTATLAALGGASSKALGALLQLRPVPRLSLTAGELEVRWRPPARASRESLVTALRAGMALARDLAAGGDLEVLIARAQDADAPVAQRVVAARALLELGGAEAKAVAEAVLRLPDAAVVVLAAAQLGRSPLPALRALALDASQADAARGAALQALTESTADVSRALQPARVVLSNDGSGPEAVAVAARIVGAARDASAIETVRRRFSRAPARAAWEVAIVALLEALVALGDADAEPAVLALLDRESPALRAAAVAALGRIGGPASVAALRERLYDERLEVGPALELLTARLSKESGRLSVPAAAGGLSEVGGVQGAVSVGRGRAADRAIDRSS